MKKLYFAFILTLISHPSSSFAENINEPLFSPSFIDEINESLELQKNEENETTEFLSEITFSDFQTSDFETSDQLKEEAPIEQIGNNTLNPSAMTILGRGITNRKTGDVIALGCLDEKCSQIQNIYFSFKSRTTSLLGRVFSLPENDNKKDLKKLMKSINKNFKIFKREENKNTNKYIGFFTYITTSFATNIVLGTFSVITPSSIVLALAAQFLFGKSPIFKKSGTVSKVFLDQNGWNWSDRPKSISNRKFNLYKKFVD